MKEFIHFCLNFVFLITFILWILITVSICLIKKSNSEKWREDITFYVMTIITVITGVIIVKIFY